MATFSGQPVSGARYQPPSPSPLRPTTWPHPSGQALKDAASLAGLNVLALVNSHSAAALQYGIERDFAAKEQRVRGRWAGAARGSAHRNSPLPLRQWLPATAPLDSQQVAVPRSAGGRGGNM